MEIEIIAHMLIVVGAVCLKKLKYNTYMSVSPPGLVGHLDTPQDQYSNTDMGIVDIYPKWTLYKC